MPPGKTTPASEPAINDRLFEPSSGMVLRIPPSNPLTQINAPANNGPKPYPKKIRADDR
jgi:hypothetical protein